MAIIISALSCNPQVFKPPHNVATRFGVRDTAGMNLVAIRYEASGALRIDGQQSVDGGQRAVGTAEQPIERTFLVTGPPGVYDLIASVQPIDENGNSSGPQQSRSCTLTLQG